MFLDTGFQHGFTERQFDELAHITKGRSCADIHAMAKNLEHKRWYPLGKATNFRQHKDGKGSIQYEECQRKEHDTFPMKFSDIKYSDLYPKKISIRDIEDSIHRQKPTVTLFDLAQIAAYENMPL